MTAPGAIGGPTPPPRDTRAALRQAAKELEGVFVAQLFRTMRESVQQGGLVEPAPGQELFTSMLDDRLALQAAEKLKGGLGEALYRQLSRRLPADIDAAGTPATGAER